MGGFFGVVSKTECVKEVFFGTDYHSHLGTRRGGMAFTDGTNFSRAIHNIENSYFRPKFECDLKNFSGNLGIGVISDTAPQPIIVTSHLGQFAVVTVGKIVNQPELEKRALKLHQHFSETSMGSINPTELVAMLINEQDTFKDGICNAMELIKGSCSLLILTHNAIYAARDKLGRTPVVVGTKKNAYAVSSETCAFPNIGFTTDKFIGPGEIIKLTPDGCEQIKSPNNTMQICSFLWIYYGYPASDYEGINVEKVRYNCGAALAKNDSFKADFVAGIPDSGIGHAIGYSNQKQIPYMRPYVKYTPTWPRSFMPADQEMRNLVAKMKLIPNRAIIENKKLVFCDDSVVRGTQMQDNVQILFEYGASEVHLRIACPPLIYPCMYLNFSASRSSLELASRKAIKELEHTEDKNLEQYADSNSEKYCNMVECIKKRLKLTSLKYQKMDDLVNAIGLPKEKLCTHCFDGSSCF